MSEPVFFSIFKGLPDIPVKIFKQDRWVFESGMNLEVSIIGKSHRIVTRWNQSLLTEFIAGPIEGIEAIALDHFQLKVGDHVTRQYRFEDFLYQVSLEIVPQIYTDMSEFVQEKAPAADIKQLCHSFEKIEESGLPRPFTGLVAAPGKNRFLTIHTYPDKAFSVLSTTDLICPAVKVTS